MTRVSTRRGMILAAMCATSLLAACNKAPTGQVVATIDGQEITLTELNAELATMQIPANADKKLVQNAALERIVERKILANAARTDGLDQNPDYIVRRQQMEEALLVQTLAKKIAAITNITNPSRLLPARICSGVRLSCGLRVMLDFLNAFRDWRMRRVVAGAPPPAGGDPVRFAASRHAAGSRPLARNRSLTRPSAGVRTCETEPGSARSIRGRLRRPTACRPLLRVRRRHGRQAVPPRTGSRPAPDRSRTHRSK